MVDETVARRYWPEGSPVGRQAQINGLSREPATIIGIVGDVPDEGLDQTTSGHVYFPVLQSPQRRMTLVLKASGDPAALTPALRLAVRDMDARIPITRVATFESLVADTLSARMLGLILLGLFGVTAVLLAGVGVYGVLAYTVARRTKEIGTRMALGAAPRVVLGAIVGHAMRLWAIGAAIGIVLAFFAVGVMGRYVAGVESGSPLPYLAAFLAMGCTAMLSATVPARRAIRVDPVQALRSD